MFERFTEPARRVVVRACRFPYLDSDFARRACYPGRSAFLRWTGLTTAAYLAAAVVLVAVTPRESRPAAGVLAAAVPLVLLPALLALAGRQLRRLRSRAPLLDAPMINRSLTA